MKKNVIVKILAGVLSVTLLVGGAVLASDGSKNIDIFFRNIKIMIDGAEYVPTDANGTVVEPFIYNGTTYLPVRAVANAFGKDVKWDGENATVYLGKEGRMQPDNRLDKLQYIEYRESYESNWFERINGTVTDYNGNIYTNGMVGYLYYGGSEVTAVYALNGQYSTFTGKILLPKNISTTTKKLSNCKIGELKLTITDENKEVLFEATGVNASSAFSFDINVKGVNKIEIRVQGTDNNWYKNFALTDLGLYK
ncbi:MAG: hypothetical protein IKI97_02820 [Clostridia bacterium]|nr:hypothetical protein [Clostridia bacterium]